MQKEIHLIFNPADAAHIPILSRFSSVNYLTDCQTDQSSPEKQKKHFMCLQ